MRILLVNDDGVHADGLHAMARELRGLGEIIITAPEVQQSGVSHSLTLYRPVMVREVKHAFAKVFAVDGTPADCVKLALKELLDKPPDVVVSGINSGLNTGNNVLYSGTLAGALEAAMFGYPAFAVSLEQQKSPRWTMAAKIARRLIETILPEAEGHGRVFNINIPNRAESDIPGIMVTRQESTPWNDVFDRRKDPRGRTYYWLKGSPAQKYMIRPGTQNASVPTDDQAVRKGYVSVTPLHRDLTDHQLMPELLKLSAKFSRKKSGKQAGGV